MCFLSMMSLSFAHVMLQTFSCALLAVTNKTWLLYYVSGNVGLYFLYKIVRRDFYYYLNMSGVLRLVVSVLDVRATQKILLIYKACRTV